MYCSWLVFLRFDFTISANIEPAGDDQHDSAENPYIGFTVSAEDDIKQFPSIRQL
jgi:hypothetical protein